MILYIKCIALRDAESTIKSKDYAIPLGSEDFIDVKLRTERNEVKGFALNYRARICTKFHAIYRIDTMHNYLHEQRFWLSAKPIPIAAMGRSLNFIFNFYLEQIKQNYQRYKRYYLEKMQAEREHEI